jgi:hypothetical protein
MDFDQAISIHSRWKHRVRTLLAKHDHSLNPAEVSLDHKCELGQWIYSAGARYSDSPEFSKLEVSTRPVSPGSGGIGEESEFR